MALFRRYQQSFEHSFERLRGGYRHALSSALDHAWSFSTLFLAFCLLSAGLVLFLGRDCFPSVDAGQIRMHMQARTGLRFEETTRLAAQVNQSIRQVIPSRDLQTVIDNVGLPYSGINLTYSNSGTIGTSDAEILVQLKQERGKSTGDYINELRRRLATEFPGVQFFFQPADIGTQILNFGTPAPVDIEIIGANQPANYEIAQQPANKVTRIPVAVDVHVQQAFDAPTLYMDLDRTRSQYVGMQARDISQQLVWVPSFNFPFQKPANS